MIGANPIELREPKTFQKVAALLSFDRAAEMLHYVLTA
jgi:DNA-binding transcriptional LysR family regulator